MKKIVIALILFVGLKLKAHLPTNDTHWQLMFQDDFNFFDNTKWLKADDCDHGGNEPQIYLTENVTTNNGNLVLTMKRENYFCTPNQQNVTSYACGNCNFGNHQFTSGWIETTLSNEVQFGYIEARIKLPFGKGFFPAFWTWTGAPYNEIDIFEMIPGHPPNDCDNGNQTGIVAHDKNIMTSNIHLQANGLGCDEPYFKPTYINDTQWHTYAIEWSPSKIIWYVDNSVVRIALNPGIHYSQLLIFNFAMNPAVSPDNSTPFPSEMLVDYVKYYQKQEDCNNLINTCAYDFTTHDNQVKNSITIGENGCANTVFVGSNTTIRASEFIALNGEVTLPLGAEFYADANGECPFALNMRCSQIFNPCFFDFSNYDNQVKQLIALGGGNCTTTITSTTNLTLQATKTITLDAGVTIAPQTGKTIVLEIKNCPQ